MSPTTFDPAAAVHEAVLRYIRLLGTTVDGADVRDADGLLAVASDLPIANGNQVLVTAPGVTPDALAEVVAWMRQRRRPFRVTLRGGLDDDLHPALERLGFTGRAWSPGMVLHPMPAGVSDPTRGADLAIEVVADDVGRAAYLRAMGPAYGLELPMVARVANARLAAEPAVTLYLGRAGGEPVSTGMAIRADGVAGVYFIGTVPEARGRGYGAAITARIGVDAAAAGCHAAILQSSPMGLGVYERLGYRSVFVYQAWTPTGA